ncbi:vWA domain-containing protein [Prescottella subtropica]|uniref:vWA domain-containing protein n=1 Tax=Prescottella subtropica TaxID=2545757 RepID=UPI0010F49E6B|nr:vWA domain-containing protein [Prescottella subtropica]
MAAGVELIDTRIDVHLFGVDGDPLLAAPVLAAYSPDRLLVDVARLRELIAPESRMDSMVHRMACPEASGLVASALGMIAVDGWWRGPDCDGTAGWLAARGLARIVCEARLAAARPGERPMLQAALSVSVGASRTMSQRDLVRLMVTEILPRVDLMVLPAYVSRPVKQWLVQCGARTALAGCVGVWRRAASLDVTDRAGWEELGVAFADAVDALCGDMPDALATTDLWEAVTPTVDAIADAARTCRDTAAQFADTAEPAPLPATTTVDVDGGQAGTGLPHHRMLRYTDPTNLERAARDQFAARLSTASYRSPGMYTQAVAHPAGRLNTRELVRLSAQTRLGLQATAKPWTRHAIAPRARVHLTFAMVFDASLTMSPWANHAGPLGWAVASAVHQLGGSCTVRGFGGDTFEVIRPGTAPAQVPRVIDSGSGSDGCDTALAEVIADSRILDRDGARVVVVLTDGKLPQQDAAGIDNAVDKLRDAGVVVLWVLPSVQVTADVIPARATVLTSVTPESFIPVVAQAVVDELAHT